MRVPFVVYFAALAYKISTDMAAVGIPPPKYLAFSGNGSRMLKFLSNSSATLEDFFDRAFDVARGATEDNDRLKVFANDNPKPLTARGGTLLHVPVPRSWMGTGRRPRRSLARSRSRPTRRSSPRRSNTSVGS